MYGAARCMVGSITVWVACGAAGSLRATILQTNTGDRDEVVSNFWPQTLHQRGMAAQPTFPRESERESHLSCQDERNKLRLLRKVES